MTDDERKGIEWWNGMDELDRALWLAEAGSAVPADAWECFKASTAAVVVPVTVAARTSHP